MSESPNISILIPATVPTSPSLRDCVQEILHRHALKAVSLENLIERLHDLAGPLPASTPNARYYERMLGEARALAKLLHAGHFTIGAVSTETFLLRSKGAKP